MPKKSKKNPADQPCQWFEFLLRTTGGTQVFVYTIPVDDAEFLTERFSQFNALDPGREFIEFNLSSGRIVHLNLNFLIGASSFDLDIRPGEENAEPGDQAGSSAGFSGWQSLTDPIDPPDVAVFIDGLDEPMVLSVVDRSELELMAATLEAEPSSAVLSFTDEENLRTRFVPARSIILMDSFHYYETELSSTATASD